MEIRQKSVLALLFLTLLSLSAVAWGAQLPGGRVASVADAMLVGPAVPPEPLAGDVAHLVRFSGVLDASGPRVIGMTFALYAEQEGSAPLWLETQNVAVDARGHYSVLLGAGSPDGVPAELFTTGAARWLGIQVESEPEGPRVAMASQPYAVTAANAQRLEGMSASEFMRTTEFRAELRRALAELRGGGQGDTLEGRPVFASEPTQGRGSPGRPATLHEKLDAILAILNEPEPIFSYQLCTEPALQVEQGIEAEGKADLALHGRVGAEGFGNGAMGQADGKAETKAKVDVKASWAVLKLGICWDIAATVRNSMLPPPSSPTLQAARANPATADGASLVDALSDLDQDMLRAKMEALAATLQIDPARLVGRLESAGELSMDGAPLVLFQENGRLAEIRENLPLPPQVRALLDDPATMFTAFENMRAQGLCNLDLPPALAGPMTDFCDLAEKERFSKLLDRVDLVTGTISTNVTEVDKKAQRLLNKMPTQTDCKFFCDSGTGKGFDFFD